MLQSVSHQACTVHGEGHRDWDRLTPHSQPTEQLLCALSSFGDFFFLSPKIGQPGFLVYSLLYLIALRLLTNLKSKKLSGKKFDFKIIFFKEYNMIDIKK